MKKVIVAYSGGLYSSLLIHWLKNKKGYQVIAFTCKLAPESGTGHQLEERAMDLGASEVVVVDLVEDFSKDYILPALKANAKYESKYLFSTALSRPLIVRELIKEAYNKDCDFIAHGCSPASNDYMRIDTIAASLSSNIEVFFPWKSWGLNSPEERERYVKRYNLNLKLEMDGDQDRVDENLWGRSMTLKKLHYDSWSDYPEDAYTWTTSPEAAPDEPAYVELSFDRGGATELNGSRQDLIEIISSLNKIGGKNGVGRIDGIENVLRGVKSRELYEAPAATILYTAHQALEELTLSKDLLQFKSVASQQYAKLIYTGLWFSELREALDSFFASTQAYVSGRVRVKLYKGNCTVAGCESKHSLFRRGTARKQSQGGFPPAAEITQLPTLLQEPMVTEHLWEEG